MTTRHALDPVSSPVSSTPAKRTLESVAAQRTELVVRVSPLAQQLVVDQLEGPFERVVPDIDFVSMRSSPRGAVEEVALERADAAVIAGEITERDRAQGLCSNHLGDHLFVLVVHPQASLRSLTSEQLRAVLIGNVRDWRAVAYDQGVIGLVFGPEGPLLQAAASALIPGDRLDSDAERLDSEDAVVERVRGDRMAMGLVSALVVERVGGVRTVAINGVIPSVREFASGRYAGGIPLNLVYRCYHGPRVRALAGFATGLAGRDLLAQRLSVPTMLPAAPPTFR